MTTWVFREVVPLRGAARLDPQRVGEICRKIKEEHREKAADALWRAARSPRHYLHKCYEWDTAKAAEAHWRDTSQRIMTSICAVSDDNDEPAPAFISVSDGGARGYYEPTEIVNSVSLQLAVMKQAARDLSAWQKRYRLLGDLCGDVQKVQAKLDARIARSNGLNGAAASAA